MTGELCYSPCLDRDSQDAARRADSTRANIRAPTRRWVFIARLRCGASAPSPKGFPPAILHAVHDCLGAANHLWTSYPSNRRTPTLRRANDHELPLQGGHSSWRSRATQQTMKHASDVPGARNTEQTTSGDNTSIPQRG
jgi:hypothetical protein